MFIAAVLGLFRCLRQVPSPALSLRLPVTYVIGGTASFWLVERVAGFWV